MASRGKHILFGILLIVKPVSYNCNRCRIGGNWQMYIAQSESRTEISSIISLSCQEWSGTASWHKSYMKVKKSHFC